MMQMQKHLRLSPVCPEVVSGLLQEPDSYGLMWERQNNGWPALQDLYLGVLNGAWAINNTAAQSILFVIQVSAWDHGQCSTCPDTYLRLSALRWDTQV